MNQFNITGDISRKPDFLELIQKGYSSGMKPETSTLQENLVRQQPICTSAVSQEAVLLELECLRQSLQHQQALAESLAERLISSQERVAQMERDFALLQQCYDEQRHLCKTTEANCQNLRTRLYRQQHQALQFKAALEECLDSPKLDQNESGFDQRYATAVPQLVRWSSTDRQSSSPDLDLTSVVTARAADLSQSEQTNHDDQVDTSTLSPDIEHQPDRHQPNVHHWMQPEASLEEADCSQEIVFVTATTHPLLSLQGQPVQPWSASQLLPRRGAKPQHQEQSTVNVASTNQAQAVICKPSQELAVTAHSTQLSPLLGSRKSVSQRKRVELPTFSRCHR